MPMRGYGDGLQIWSNPKEAESIEERHKSQYFILTQDLFPNCHFHGSQVKMTDLLIGIFDEHYKGTVKYGRYYDYEHILQPIAMEIRDQLKK